MHVSETTDRLTITDVPRGVWGLGLLFVASGTLVLCFAPTAPEWKAFVLWERLAVVVIGLSHFAGGLYQTVRATATRTVLDRASRTGVQELRPFWPVLRTATPTFSLADAKDIEIVRDRDHDGDPTYQLRLWLRDSRKLWLQAQPTNGEGRVLDAAVRVRRFLGLVPGAMKH